MFHAVVDSDNKDKLNLIEINLFLTRNYKFAKSTIQIESKKEYEKIKCL